MLTAAAPNACFMFIGLTPGKAADKTLERAATDATKRQEGGLKKVKNTEVSGANTSAADTSVRASLRAVGSYAVWAWCLPSANSSIIFLQNAGMSSGLRLVTRPLSVITCSSAH